MVYLNNNLVTTFVNKAQNKIADLSTLLVQRGGNLPAALHLLLELSDFIECLDDPYNTWTLVDVLNWIDVYNHRANLNAISFLLMTGIEVNLITGGGSLSLPITSNDVSDFDIAVNRVVRGFPHNSLNSIQPNLGLPGYVATERYHINRTMYDKLYDFTYPFTAPVIGLTLTPFTASNTFGYYELGTVLASAALQGSITLNSGRSVLYYRYKKNGVYSTAAVNAPVLTNPITVYTDTNISANTIYTFETSFEVGGILTTTKNIGFRQAMFFGIRDRATAAQTTGIVDYTKVIRDAGNMNLSFTLAAGNTLLPDSQQIVPVAIFPASWGLPTSIKVGVYEFITDWIFTAGTIISPNGVDIYNVNVGTFKNAIEGNVKFNISF